MENSSYKKWLWESIGQQCSENLKKNGFDSVFVQDKASALKTIIDSDIIDYKTFGFAGSGTVRELSVIEQLKKAGKTVYDHWDTSSKGQDLNIRLSQGRADCFFCSANAISLDGQIINVDGVGNRTSAMAFGPKQVVIVAGMNKVTKDLHSGLRRIREIAGPMRAKSLGMKTPCAKTGICSDCDSPQRICRITTILHRKPMMTKVLVILINEEIGF